MELWQKDHTSNHENPMYALNDHSRNVFNPNITMNKGTCNDDKVIIMLTGSIKSGDISYMSKLL